MTGPESHPDYCPNCITSGLPLLLARYAVARADAEVREPAPLLQAPFDALSDEQPLPTGAAYYTLRLLRGGYVYSYHQARDEWKAWQLNEYGDLSAFDIRDQTPPPQNDTQPARCSRHGETLLSKCIIVPDAAQATLLWLAYSSAPWTRRVWGMHQDPTYRQRHMRCIDVAAWRAGTSTQTHVAGLGKAASQVAELHLANPSTTRTITRNDRGVQEMPVNAVPGVHAFEYSLDQWANYSIAQVDQLIAQADIAAGHPQAAPPALVALDDPIGIISDLNQLAIERILEWEAEPERQERVQSASTISLIEGAVRQGAFEEVGYRRREAALFGRGVVSILGGKTNAEQLARPLQAWNHDIFAVEDEEAVLVQADKSWRKYSRHLRQADAHTHWLEKIYAPAQERFYEDTVADLDRAMIAWWRAPSFKQHMQSNFDSKDSTSGVLYQEVVTNLLRDSASRGLIMGYLLEQLQLEDLQDPGAILLRAQMWNQDALLKTWKQTMEKTSVGPGARDWLTAANGLSNALKALLDAESAGKLSAMFQGTARLVEQLSGPLTRMIGGGVRKAFEGSAVLLPTRMQVGMLTALAQSASPDAELVDLSGYTTPKRARNALAMAVSERAGLNAASQARAVAAHAVASADADMDGKRFRIGLVALVDSDQLRLFKALNAKAVITGTSRHAELSRTLTTVDMYDAIRGSFAKVGNPSFAYGTASLVFASASLSELSRQYSTALPRERPLLGANFAAGVGALVGDSAMLLGEIGAKLPWFSQKLAEPLGRWAAYAQTRAAAVYAAGRWLSGIAGMVLGGLTFYEGARDFELAPSYGIGMMVSGGLTIAASFLILSGYALPLAIVLMIVAAVVAVVVAWFKPDDVERWIDGALHFGRNKSRRFDSIDEQLEAMAVLRR
ncbi:T6SS effector BTH_I2691 family protein [Stenotrophomonas sp. ZAC14A_NAIMI4_1]|uniref:T6SS effector BTH_I2691 family protein n=1 Tax=Stenotrophomonas sp. ZAC14A_NAIMI4_1 TaxID=2072412 RepID=UPI00131EDAE1|nr:T6SS effector BTH_I2691 family protein [Stenotrophomonas sp. ZAC14A_NAIMI4_1]